MNSEGHEDCVLSIVVVKNYKGFCFIGVFYPFSEQKPFVGMGIMNTKIQERKSPIQVDCSYHIYA